MAFIDKVFDFTPAMVRASNMATTDRNYQLALSNEIVALTLDGTARIADLFVMADSHAWDGSGIYPDLTSGGTWCILEADGADCYYRCRQDNVSSMTDSTQGEKIPDGDAVRFKLTTATRYVEYIGSAGGAKLKKRFSNSPG